MSSEALSLARPLRLTWRKPRLEHFVIGGAVVALVILVVLPLLSLLFGSVRGEEGLSLDHFAEVLSGRLYVTALKNSLMLGAWTSLFGTIIGLTLAWAVSRTDVPAKPLLQLTATLSYLSPPFLTAIAFTYLFSPNAGLINVFLRGCLG
jgi:iron(III) transport system permease protein